ncbi:MAG: ABC transporter substrate-binding protein [Prevotella sp.]|jgi:NitT/TauT family transport system substrate-binding protein|nr:ABC transporter substrate-binding protein [Prevotella sp.]
MKRYLIYIASVAVVLASLSACGKSYDEKKRISESARRQDLRQDSLALKIATVPTMDCLPLFVAVDDSMFAKAGVDVRLKRRNAQIDCDTLIRGRHVEGIVSDLMRTERLKRRGLALRYITATNAYWQMIANRRARVKEVAQLADKMVAITRFSATDYLAEIAIKAAKPKYDVFQVQINDVNLRLKMLINNEMDAAVLTEPQATTARLYKNPVLTDSRDQHLDLGVVAFREACWKDKHRQAQVETFVKVYNQACDSINKNGVQHYAAVISKYMGADDKTIQALPKLQYRHAQPPQPHDVEVARKRWK